MRFDLRPGIRRLFRLPLGTPSAVRADADEELESLLASRVDYLVARGMSPDDARVEALRRLGGTLEDARHHVHHSAERRERRMRARQIIDTVLHDVRYALHGLRGSPGFAATAIITLALGIGANAAMFGIIDRLLFRMPAFLTASDRVHRVYFARTSGDGTEFANMYTQFNRYRDVTRTSRTIEVAAAYTTREIAVGRGEATRELTVGVASASLWQLFDAAPVIGRFFTRDEDRSPGGEKVAVLSYSYWRSQFNGAASVLGRRISIGPSEYQIIGVAPRGFAALDLAEPIAFVPLAPYGDDNMVHPPSRYDLDYATTWLEMYVRLRPRVTAAAAAADLTNAVIASYTTQFAADGRPVAPFLATAHPRIVVASPLLERGPRASTDTKVAAWLVGVTVIVLLVSCANVGNLLLTRALRRRREIAVRLALGATRARLLTQLVAESLVLAAFGGTAGVLIAHWGGGLLRATLLPNLSIDASIADNRVLLFSGCIALAVGVITGVAPAIQANRADVASTLKSGHRDGSVHFTPLRTGLMLVQAALSVVLLLGAGLFVQSVRHVAATRLGFDADRLLWVEAQGRGVKFDTLTRVTLRERLMERAKALPATENVAAATTVPFGGETVYPIFVAGVDSIGKLGSFVLQTGSPSYFATLGTRVLRGRGITAEDRQGAERVIIVSESMARRLWPGRDAIGQCVRVGADTAPCRTVVGIAEDVKHGGFGSDTPMLYYLPIEQVLHASGWFFVRTHGRAALQAEALRRALQPLMPGASFVTVTPVTENLAGAERSWTLGATMFTIFGALALLVAAVGLYGVMAYSVAQRTHEMGVRIALGAPTGSVIRLVVVQGMPVILAGTAIGCLGALVGGRWLAPLLFNESVRDPVVFIGVTVTMVATAMAATWIPAHRAASVDPLVALRTD